MQEGMKIQTMSAKSDCAYAAVKAFNNKSPFAWGNQHYMIEAVKRRGDKDIEVHFKPFN